MQSSSFIRFITCACLFALLTGGCDTQQGEAVATNAAGIEAGAAAVNAAFESDAGVTPGAAGDAALLDAPSTFVIAGDLDAAIVAIATSPLALVPAFSPSIHDYYVRCASGQNQLTITATSVSNAVTATVDLLEDDEIDVSGQSYIRCLPHDFPTISVTLSADAGTPTPGYYLVTTGPYAAALDTNGTPVWYARGTAVGNVDSLAAGTLSYMPDFLGPFSYSDSTEYEIRTLEPLATTTVTAVGSPTDGHELRLLPNGDYLLLSYPFVSNVDLTGLQTFGADETIADCEVQEISPSGTLVWSWLASDHVDPVRESLEPAADTINGASVIDVFHFNSIDVDASGNLLLSARHTNALFYIDKASGRVVWKLGGTAYSKDGATLISVTSDPQGGFNMQHDARFLPNGDISLFDDHGATPGVARGVEYAIDFDAGTASVAFETLGIAQSAYEGSFRRYSDGESVVGWGYIATDPRVVTEVNGAGVDVLDIAFIDGGQSYRAVKVPLSQLDIGALRAATAK